MRRGKNNTLPPVLNTRAYGKDLSKHSKRPRSITIGASATKDFRVRSTANLMFKISKKENAVPSTQVLETTIEQRDIRSCFSDQNKVIQIVRRSNRRGLIYSPKIKKSNMSLSNVKMDHQVKNPKYFLEHFGSNEETCKVDERSLDYFSEIFQHISSKEKYFPYFEELTRKADFTKTERKLLFGKRTLILDMDETLIHCECVDKEDVQPDTLDIVTFKLNSGEEESSKKKQIYVTYLT